jgi:hypothetical protein
MQSADMDFRRFLLQGATMYSLTELDRGVVVLFKPVLAA